MRIRGKLRGLILLVAWAVSTGAGADGVDLSVFGKIGLETRWYPENAAYPGQRSHLFSVSSETTFLFVGEQDRSFTLTPYFRYDATDSERNLVDLREAYYLAYGDIGSNEWELRLGVDKVFWGVAELRNLVNIVNQVDLVANPDEKTRMGQPMARLSLSGEWGALELIGMPYHRTRTYPGRGGRYRSVPIVDNDRATYESGSAEHHLDLAARFSGYVGPVDLGLSVFRGTNRDPVFATFDPIRGVTVPYYDPIRRVLVPRYDLIRQYGLEAQVTTGPWLLKLEAIHRSGMRNLAGRKEDYVAALVGGEYTIYSVFDSAKDLGLIVEWISDGRDENTTTAFQNDLFLATRLSFNDVQSTEAVFSIALDLDTDSRSLDARVERRLSDSWSLKANATAIWDTEEDSFFHPVRQDDYVSVILEYHF